MPVVLKVVLLGGQGIWYDRLTHEPSGLGDTARGSTPEVSNKATLRRELKSRLGVEKDRWVVVDLYIKTKVIWLVLSVPLLCAGPGAPLWTQ